MSEWHYSNDGAVNRGPVSLENILELLGSGEIHAHTLVWRKGQSDWLRLAESALAEHLAPKGVAPGEATPGRTATPTTAAEPTASADWSRLQEAEGPAVDPARHVAPGTGLHVTIGWLLGIPAGLIALAMCIINPVFLVIAIGSLLSAYFMRAKMRARIHGSAIRVSENQFPEIHACVQAYSRRLGLPEAPATYVYEASFINAFAMKIGGRGYVMLTDDIIDACSRSGDMRTLRFIIGHELAHHALGHTGIVRGWIRTINMRLSRLDEFSCDAVGAALDGDRQASARAMLILAAGPQLFPRLNLRALDEQADEVIADSNSKKSERKMTHPLLLRRYASLRHGWDRVYP